MKKVLLCLIGILLVMVEGSITNYLNIFDINFNIVIIYMTIISLYLNELEASRIGMIIGIVKDIALGAIFGVNGLILFIISYAISYLKHKIYKENIMTIFALVFITTLFDCMVNIATTSQVYNTYSILTLVLKGMFIIPVLNGILSMLLYRVSKGSILKLKED